MNTIMITESLIKESERYISNLLEEQLPDGLFYHSFQHALRVKEHVEIIGSYTKLSEEELNIARLSALFHDTGFIHSIENHEAESIKIAKTYLKEKNIDLGIIDKVASAIAATKIPQSPKNKTEEVLCDADLMYIASEDCYEQYESMYEETMVFNPSSNRNIFDLESLRFFAMHTYFTDYGKKVLQPKKELASKQIFERMKRRELRKSKKGSVLGTDNKVVNYSRGVETIFRLTARNQINLNSIADNKANILISVNAIIISIIITMLATNFTNLQEGLIPILIFLLNSVVTVIIAILSTRPKLSKEEFTQEDLIDNKVDLIFFGNFIHMKYDEYLSAVKTMIENDEHLYSTMIKNQYSLGKILGRKFDLVKLAYNVFMIGIIATVIAFLITSIIQFQ